MLRPEFVRRKLQLIAEELSRLLVLKDETYESLTGDPIKVAALERYVERIVGRAIDVNEHLVAELSDGSEDKVTRLTYRDTFLKLVELGVYPADFAEEISKSAGLRNILVHEYNDIDRRILYNSIEKVLDQYRRYSHYIAEFIDTREGA